MVSGGSSASLSAMPAAFTVSTQVWPAIALSAGSSTTLVAGLLVDTVKLAGTPVGHSKSKLPFGAFAAVSKLTLSLKLIVTVEFGDTSVAPFTGVVDKTAGAASMRKLRTTSAARFCGGSIASESLTCAATTVATQAAPAG